MFTFKKPKQGERILIKNKELEKIVNGGQKNKHDILELEDVNSVITFVLESQKEDENNKNEFTVGEIVKEIGMGIYEIKILEGKNKGKKVNKSAEQFTQLAHVVILFVSFNCYFLCPIHIPNFVS